MQQGHSVFLLCSPPQDKAHRWLSSGVADSTTTNGVLLSRPISPDSERNDGREWFEVSVLGNLYERIIFKQDGHDMCSLKPAVSNGKAYEHGKVQH